MDILDKTSDPLQLLCLIGAFEYAVSTGKDTVDSFCSTYKLRPKALKEVRQLRIQLTEIVRKNFNMPDLAVNPSLPPPSREQRKVLRQIILTGYIDQVAMRKDFLDESVNFSKKRVSKVPYKCLYTDEDVFIHPSSVLYHNNSPPEVMTFIELIRNDTKTTLRRLLYLMRVKIVLEVTDVDRNWLSRIGVGMCSYGKPLDRPLPRYNNDRTEVEVWCPISFGSKSWPLPAVKIKQKRIGTRWVFERQL